MNLTTKQSAALHAVNAAPGSHYTLACALGVTRNAARTRADRLTKMGLLRSVNMGTATGAMLFVTRAGLFAAVADLDTKRDLARGAWVLAKLKGEDARTEAAELGRLTVELEAAELRLADHLTAARLEATTTES